MNERGDFAMLRRQREYEWRLMERANKLYEAERERLARESRYQWVGERELDAAARKMSGAIWYAMASEREPELAEVLWTVS